MRFEKLGNLALEIKTGKTPPTANLDYFGDEIRWYTPKDLDHEKDLTLSVRGITQLAIDDKKAVIYQPNTVLLGCIGDIGKVGITRTFSSSNQQITGILVDEKLLYPDYLYYWLKANKKLLQNASSSSIVSILNNKQLKDIRISLPEKLEEQIRIAEILSETESLIRQRKECVDLLDDFLKNTFLDMFGEPAKNDKKWKKVSLDEITSQITDGEHTTPLRTEKGIKLLSARNIRDGFIDYKTGHDFISENEYVRISKRCKPEKSNILMSCSGSVGRVSIIKTDEPLSIVRSVALIKPLPKIVNSNYLQFWMQSTYFQNEVKKSSKTSSQSNIFTGAIKKLPVVLPPLKIQDKFSLIVEIAENIKEHYKLSLKEFENLFDSLSQRAFKGDLDLSKLDVSKKLKGIESKAETTNISELTLNKSMKQFIKQTTDIQKKVGSINKMLPDSLLKQINTLSQSIEVFQKLPTIPIQLAQSIKSFEKIKDDTSKLNKNDKEQFTSKFSWEEVNFEMVAKWIKEKYTDYHFNSELLLNYLVNERVTFPNYHSSEELKSNPKLIESDDLKSFIFSALNNENQFIKLEQFFFNADEKEFELKLHEKDHQLIKEKTKKLRSGIYFKIVK